MRAEPQADPGHRRKLRTSCEREETGAERRTLLQLAGRILDSWPATIRLLTVVAGGLWLLNATGDLGLVRLGKP
ncbi:hypothetical protein CFP71_39540 [Amycolatopsis thailandensis]|uniref:Uncharacterized protein n=1 Tax=Amycolatopsis thailandensis TaxID=589330 RepID=A0A229RE56_9PSEU|nr:hypothetical protein [Amycolatopsis thailandensis]OXM44946.1 hypothetical protein CFP71_39540 [Amycolatopsis thailandensis]